VGIQLRNRSVFLESVLLVFLGNIFIFLIAGHEVRSFSFSYGVSPNQFPTDHSAYAVFLICLVGALS
jgi:hypothetical protein